MAFYKDFERTDDHAFNIYNALQYCKRHNERALIFENKTYDLYAEKASECLLCISNHDVYGLKRVAFLIADMDGFTVDGNGATFLIHGSTIPFAIRNSSHICVKNCTIDVDQTMILEAVVTDSCAQTCDVAVRNAVGYGVQDGKLFFCNDDGDRAALRWICVRSRGDDRAFIAASRDLYHREIRDVTFEKTGDQTLRIRHLPRHFDCGMHLLLGGNERYGCNIFCVDSQSVEIRNVTMYRSYGMGVVGQKSADITVDALTVRAKAGSVLSLNADATHFVHCKGTVTVKNSCFSEQMDDALNIHGVFTRIVGKTEDYLLVQYMHPQAKGINTYERGGQISVVDPASLLSKGVYELDGAEPVNRNYTKLYVRGGTGSIDPGDLVEDLTWSGGLVFEHNRVENNRARGLLIAAKGTVLIRHNYFHTPGTAILFESNGTHWFESGGTTDVTIRENVFDRCKFARDAWGKSVIDVVPRDRFDAGRYYHQSIDISHNRFVGHGADLICADNVKNITIRANVFDEAEPNRKIRLQNCGTVCCET